MRSFLYTVLAAEDKIGKHKGQYQLLWLDLIFDENKKCFVVEVNFGGGLLQVGVPMYLTPHIV